MRLLILDNEPFLLEIMEMAFTAEGFDVLTATATENVLALVTAYQPHVVLIDFSLKGLNGGWLCSLVKSDEKTGRLPVILTSAYPDKGIQKGSFGCNDFISKPFDLYNLIARTKALVTVPVF